jgi:hypothetical protein
MEGIYLARDLLKPTWSDQEIRAVLYNMAAAVGLPMIQQMMPEVYRYIFEK